MSNYKSRPWPALLPYRGLESVARGFYANSGTARGQSDDQTAAIIQ
jgi:hypothetical protein